MQPATGAAGTSLAEQVAGLSSSVRERLLSNASSGAVLPVKPGALEVWGFANARPSAEPQAAASSSIAGAGDYLAALRASKTFSSPDCTEAMAAAWGVQGALDSLQGSVMFSRLGSQRQESVRALRTDLKQEIKRAWAQEAVSRGVLHAKKQDYPAALACYRDALDLDASCVDAWVARGAAYANQGNLKQALENFDKAIGLSPEHANALKYRAAILQRMPAGGEHSVPSQLPSSTRQPVQQGHAAAAAAAAATESAPPPAAAQAARGTSSPIIISSDSRSSHSSGSSSDERQRPGQPSKQPMDVQTALRILSQHRKPMPAPDLPPLKSHVQLMHHAS